MPIIKSPSERKARVEEKRLALLRFLREEIYTTPAVAGAIMGIGERGARSTVAALEKEGLLLRHQIKLMPQLPPLVLIGITQQGQAFAFDPHAGEKPIWKYFEPDKLNLVYLSHTLETQRLRVSALASGLATRWLSGERLGGMTKGIKRPDAVLLTVAGTRIALEVERTLKSRQRYAGALKSHLQAIHQNKWDRVIWACPDADMAARVSAMVASVHKGKLPEVLIFCEYQDFLKNL